MYNAHDQQYGLPIEAKGDVCHRGLTARMNGYNQGVLDYINRHGMSWNSRLRSLHILANPSGFFEVLSEKAVSLVVNGPECLFEPVQATLSLVESHCGPAVRLKATSLFQKLEDPESFEVLHPKDWWRRLVIAPPPLWYPGPGSKDIQSYRSDLTRNVTCIPGPQDSHLVIFRHDSRESAQGNPAPGGISFEILDTQLGKWLPARVNPRPLWIQD
ncbi:MAG TPA: hypothetical protein PJ982_19920 [Lacipirellulaceae bacterium]|nr:hypothetical protein [Lacipirellulaceae bacterium]